MPIRLSPLLLACAMLVLAGATATGARAQYNLDPMAHWRKQIEEARRKSLPAPPQGTRELHWNALSPAGWNPGKILQRLGVRGISDSNPRAREVEAQIQEEWDKAPTVPLDDESPVRLTGYPIMLSEGEGLARTILLVPYKGACIHSPAPPANQMVMVTFKQGLPRNMDTTAIWVTGKLHVLAAPTPYGRVAYTMSDASWQKYPVERYTLPQYVPLR